MEKAGFCIHLRRNLPVAPPIFNADFEVASLCDASLLALRSTQHRLRSRDQACLPGSENAAHGSSPEPPTSVTRVTHGKRLLDQVLGWVKKSPWQDKSRSAAVACQQHKFTQAHLWSNTSKPAQTHQVLHFERRSTRPYCERDCQHVLRGPTP